MGIGNVPRMNFSNSLSLSDSSKLAGGGLRTSSGLYFAFETIFPVDFMTYLSEEGMSGPDETYIPQEFTCLDLFFRPGVHSHALPLDVIYELK